MWPPGRGWFGPVCRKDHSPGPPGPLISLNWAPERGHETSGEPTIPARRAREANPKSLLLAWYLAPGTQFIARLFLRTPIAWGLSLEFSITYGGGHEGGGGEGAGFRSGVYSAPNGASSVNPFYFSQIAAWHPGGELGTGATDSWGIGSPAPIYQVVINKVIGCLVSGALRGGRGARGGVGRVPRGRRGGGRGGRWRRRRRGWSSPSQRGRRRGRRRRPS